MNITTSKEIFMSTPTRLSNGISTNDAQMLFGNYPLPAPFSTSGASTTGVAEYANDFVASVAEYTVSGSSSTFALTAGNGGLALLTPGGTTTATAAYKTASNVAFVAGNQSVRSASAHSSSRLLIIHSRCESSRPANSMMSVGNSSKKSGSVTSYS